MPAPACAGLPIQQVLIVRIAAGEVLGRICREPGLLNYVTVWNWRRRNAGFDAEYREAQRQGRERRHWAFDEVRTERLLAGQRAGEKIMEIVARRGSPVGLRLYKHWMGAQAPFHCEVRRLQAQNRRRTGAPTQVFDPALADRLAAQVAADLRIGDAGPATGFPCRKVIDRWRRSRPEFDRVLRIARRCVAAGRRRGQLVRTRCLGRSSTSSAVEPACGRWRRACLRPRPSTSGGDYPEFAAAQAGAKADQADWFGDRLWALTQGGLPAAADRREVARLKARCMSGG